MTEPRTFHFAVKPGCKPVQLPSLSAHDVLPWIAEGYECMAFAKSHHSPTDRMKITHRLHDGGLREPELHAMAA